MTIILYLCENGLQNYAENVSKKNNILLCLDNDGVEKDEYINLSANVIQKEDISFLQYDYLVILSRDVLKSREIKGMLLLADTPEYKILEYCYYEKNPVRSPIEIFYQEHLGGYYDTFIFGMSHSYGGCLDVLLKGNVYKFSAPSMDLYYHYKVLQDICNSYDMKKVKKVIFELPYYVFNYDISMCKSTFMQRINYYYYFEDYHHFGENNEEKQYIYMFEKLNEICEKPIYAVGKSVTKSKKNILLNMLNEKRKMLRYALMPKMPHTWTAEEMSDIEQLRPHVWYKYHEKTIEENIEIWEKIKQLLNGYANLEIKVMVFPFNPLFIRKNSEAIEEMKHTFVNTVNIPMKNIVDYFECYLDREDLFEDECHLNLKGAYNFSKRIKKII